MARQIETTEGIPAKMASERDTPDLIAAERLAAPSLADTYCAECGAVCNSADAIFLIDVQRIIGFCTPRCARKGGAWPWNGEQR